MADIKIIITSPSEYVDLARRTLPDQYDPMTIDEQRKLVSALGLAGEAGEVADYYKKTIGHRRSDLPKDKLKRELGDTLWYIATLIHMEGWTMEEVMGANIEKLVERFPAGFTSERSAWRSGAD